MFHPVDGRDRQLLRHQQRRAQHCKVLGFCIASVLFLFGLSRILVLASTPKQISDGVRKKLPWHLSGSSAENEFVIEGMAGILAGFLAFAVGERYSYNSKCAGLMLRSLDSATDTRPPILFVRSFGRSPLLYKYVHSAVDTRAPVVTGGQHLCVHLGRLIADYGVMVEIGNPEEAVVGSFPPGIIPDNLEIRHLYVETPQDLWKKNFILLAAASKAVIVIPETTPGVVAEVELLASESLLHKVLFVMPGTPKIDWARPYPSPLGGGISFQERWEKVRRFWEPKGLELPEYDHQGMIFRFASKDRMSATYTQDNCAINGRALADALTALPCGGTSLRDTIATIGELGCRVGTFFN